MNHAKTVLISGASFAGLSAAFWMRQLGYDVTVVEVARELRRGGTAVNLQGDTIGVVERMGILPQVRARKLSLEAWEYKNADDVTVGGMGAPPSDEIEIERDVLLDLLFGLAPRDIELVFDDRITALRETGDRVEATFERGAARSFDLVLGCDGTRSSVRRLWFGPDAEYTHFLEQYFSITIVDKSLIRPNLAQMFNVPGKAVMLNAYKGKTDIVFAFVSEKEIPYDHRDEAQQRRIIAEQFSRIGWRAAELLEEVKGSKSFYFDKLCQVRMPGWSKGRVALVGDAAYCPSPAAGRGGSLAIDGAAAFANALSKYPEDYARAFAEYDTTFRPVIEEVQADAVRFGLEGLCPRTEEAIQRRNAGEIQPFERE